MKPWKNNMAIFDDDIATESVAVISMGFVS